jgi:hypothetical protein
LTALGVAPCFTNFLLETRNSQSITASLQDLTFGSFTQTVPPPSTVGAARCGTGNVTLTASGCSGGTLSWFDAASGGTLVNTGPSYTVSLSATKTFYVDCTTADGCLSARTAVTGTINGNPTVVANASPAGNVNIGSAPPHYSLIIPGCRIHLKAQLLVHLVPPQLQILPLQPILPKPLNGQ